MSLASPEFPPTPPTGSTRDCRLCGIDIPETATVCYVCKGHQSKLWNAIPNVPMFITLVTVIVSGFLYSYDQVAHVVKEWTWTEGVELWTHASVGRTLVRNVGDGDIFLSSVKYQRDDFLVNVQVEKTIAPGELEFYEPAAGNLKDRVFMPLSWGEMRGGVRPSHYIYLSENNSQLANYRELLINQNPPRQLAEFEGKVTVDYYAMKDNQRHQQERKCIAVPIQFAGEDAGVKMTTHSVSIKR